MKLSAVMENDGILVDEQLQRDLVKVADIHFVEEEDEFKNVFWEQQVISLHHLECLHYLRFY